MRRALWLVLVSTAAHAATVEAPDAFAQEVEDARNEIAAQLQLHAYDLLDELVFRWTQEPPFENESPLVLADVTVPVGFGSGLQALIENHFVSLLVKNPRAKLQLVHCPQCMAMVVHSGAKGTVVARGVDEPETLAKAGVASGSRHALFLDFEAEGAALVLRVRITSLEPNLPIVYARTISTTTASPSLLRSEDKLKSAAEARKEYLDLLEGKGLLLVPISFAVRTYQPNPNAFVATAPLLWLNVGIEAALSQARAWTASFSAGITWAPESHVGWSLTGRVGRLLTGNTVSLTHPDVYAYVGGSVISMYGTGALAFRNNIPTPEDLKASTGTTPNVIFGTLHFGLMARLKNRIAVSAYIETAPALNGSPVLGNFIDLGFTKLQTLGFEVLFCF
ncbi:MAG: hypothetical protein IPJ65_25100 [Archangiaceae bacterium]|nr:hypothetical protein [Archangiaceae bacterium]